MCDKPVGDLTAVKLVDSVDGCCEDGIIIFVVLEPNCGDGCLLDSDAAEVSNERLPTEVGGVTAVWGIPVVSIDGIVAPVLENRILVYSCECFVLVYGVRTNIDDAFVSVGLEVSIAEVLEGSDDVPITLV